MTLLGTDRGSLGPDRPETGQQGDGNMRLRCPLRQLSKLPLRARLPTLPPATAKGSLAKVSFIGPRHPRIRARRARSPSSSGSPRPRSVALALRDIATKLVERFAHGNLLIPRCSPIGPIRFTGIYDWYTSSLTAPNEACQISPNLYEARNPQPAIADNRP